MTIMMLTKLPIPPSNRSHIQQIMIDHYMVVVHNSTKYTKNSESARREEFLNQNVRYSYQHRQGKISRQPKGLISTKSKGPNQESKYLVHTGTWCRERSHRRYPIRTSYFAARQQYYQDYF